MNPAFFLGLFLGNFLGRSQVYDIAVTLEAKYYNNLKENVRNGVLFELVVVTLKINVDRNFSSFDDNDKLLRKLACVSNIVHLTLLY